MTEKIGNITLDYKHYPGEDLYCDGTVEDELLEIVKDNAPSEYGKIIEERESWPILYHLSPLRGNIIEWMQVEAGAKVLEIGSGCGAITGTLAKKAGSVTCIDLSKKRSHINAYRNKECENVTIHVGNFKDIEPELPCDYDYIFLIGVFEYGQGYIGTDNPYEEFLTIIKKHIKADGKIVIAIENKFGLKYFAGCKEDHLGTYFSSIEDYPQGGGVRTFTRNGLEKICNAVGIEEYSFYYPYPDYKFTTSVYSDKYLPKQGELSNNMRNFDRDRMLLFDEKNAFDCIIREGLFPQYSNSYMLIIGKEPETKYVKYSNDRAPEFAIRTDISENEAGERRVCKLPVTSEAPGHIKHIGEAFRKLSARYEGGLLSVNRCEETQGGLCFEYLTGKTLEELLDECVDRDDYPGFSALIEKYMQAAGYNQESEITDYDLIFSNIIAGQEGWTILDYEWTFEKRMSIEEITARALYCYLIGAWKRREASFRFLEERFSYGEAEMERLADKELEFQHYVTGKRLSMVEMRNRIGNAILPVQEILQKEAAEAGRGLFQIYEDKGEGFNEKDSYFLKDIYGEGNVASFEISISPGVKSVRIDPGMEPCMLSVRKLLINGEPVRIDGKRNLLNGNLISKSVMVFATKDPNITIDLAQKTADEKQLCAEFEIAPFSNSMARQIVEELPKRKKFW